MHITWWEYLPDKLIKLISYNPDVTIPTATQILILIFLVGTTICYYMARDCYAYLN